VATALAACFERVPTLDKNPFMAQANLCERALEPYGGASTSMTGKYSMHEAINLDLRTMMSKSN
jgi:hypothetical protein